MSTSNRYECLGEAAVTTTAEVGWNSHPLFMPTADDNPLVALPNPSPAAAFPNWWGKPAGTVEEAEKFVEASQKISDKRNLFWESKDRGPENIREAAAQVASEGAPPHPRMGGGDGEAC